MENVYPVVQYLPYGLGCISLGEQGNKSWRWSDSDSRSARQSPQPRRPPA